jgi:hypothetical protein
VYLLLLLAVFALTGVFAVQNEGSQVLHLLGYSRSLPIWVPTTTAVGVVSGLLLLGNALAGLRYRIREIGHARDVAEHHSVIDALRAENADLREELAALVGELRGAASSQAGGAVPDRK